MAMKKVIDLLVDDGIPYRKKGQGRFVMNISNRKNALTINERSLEGLTRASKGHASSKILEFRYIFADRKIAEILNIKKDDPVYEIIRLRYIDNVPHVIEKTYMAPSTIPGITVNVLNGSVYEYIETKLGLRIASAQKTVRADVSNETDQKELRLKPNEPVLEVEQIAYLDNGTPFEYSFSRHRYDMFEFTSFSLRR